MTFAKGTFVKLKATGAVPKRYQGRTATVVSQAQPNSRFVAEVNARETGKPKQTRLLALSSRDVTQV
tara:strand:- start:273 stop:473 length:201 start_codon:yes stop_codon:yes gene_type:complete